MTQTRLNVTEGSGRGVAVDRVVQGDGGTADYQIVKFGHGIEGTVIMVSATDPLPITTPDDVFTVTPVLGTVAYTLGRVLFVPTEIPLVTRGAAIPVRLESLAMSEKGTKQAEILLLFYNGTVSHGTVNGVSTLSGADALKYVGGVYVTYSDYVNLGSVSVASPQFNPAMMKPSSTSLFVAALTLGTPTYGASDLTFNFGFSR